MAQLSTTMSQAHSATAFHYITPTHKTRQRTCSLCVYVCISLLVLRKTHLLDLKLLLSVCCVAAAGTGFGLLGGCVGHFYVGHGSWWFRGVREGTRVSVLMRVECMSVFWVEDGKCCRYGRQLCSYYLLVTIRYRYGLQNTR